VVYFFLFLHFFTQAFGQEISLPALKSPVMDEANFLNEQERESLAQLCYHIYTSQGPQVTILTVNNLQGLPIEDFSIKVAEKWQLGTKEKDNGLLIIASKEDRKIRIEVGNGIEGEITDFDSSKMIQNLITPNFRRGDFYQGFRSVLEEIADRFKIPLKGESTKVVRRIKRNKDNLLFDVFPFVVLVLILGQIFLSKNTTLRGFFSGLSLSGLSYFFIPGIGVAIFFIFILGLILGLIGLNNLLYILASSGGGRGYHGGSSGGGGRSWSGGGGGFSGGGSSGSW